MFAFSQIEPNRLGTVSKWDIPASTWLGLKWEHGYESTMGRSISRMTEDFLSEGPMLAPEDANAQWSIPGEGGLTFKESINAGRAQLMHERKRAELDRLRYLDAAKHNAISFKGVAGFGASLVGGLSHPLDLGISFIPLFGQSTKAAQLAKTGAGAFRQRLARGLLATEDDLIRLGVPAPRLSASIMEGMVGNAIAEVPVFIQNARDQAIYGIEDSVINVLAGGAFAGGVRALARALEFSGELFVRLDDRIKSAAAGKAFDDFMQSRPINVESIVRVDEAAIRERVKFDEAQARRDAALAIGDESPPRSALDIIFEAQERSVGDTQDAGLLRVLLRRFKEGDRSRNVVENMASLLGRRYDPTTPTAQADYKVGSLLGERFNAAQKVLDEAGAERQKIEQLLAEANRLLSQASEPATRSTLEANISKLKRELGQLTEAVLDAQTILRESLGLEAHLRQMDEDAPVNPANASIERERRINELVESKRKDWNEELRFQEEAKKEIARQQAQGKVLPDEEIERLTLKETPDEADVAALKEDAANIEKELNADPERSLSAAEQRELGEIASYEKAVDAALPCVIQSLING